ncbi:unnamed protein product, partial [Prorocentrum cordatum]
MGSQKGTERMHACTAEQQAPGWPAGRGKAGASEASVSEQRSAGLATGAAGPAWQGRARERVACADTAGSVAVDSVALRGLSEGLSWQAHGPLTLLDGDRTDVAFRGVYRALELPCSAAGGPLASLRGVTRQGAAGPPGRARKARRLGCAERALCSRAEGASTRATGALSACAPSQGFPARPRVLEGAEQSRSGKLPRGSPDSMWALRQKPPPWKGRSRSVGFLRAWGVDPRRQPGRRAAKDSGKVEGCDSPGMLDGPSVRAHGADGAPPPKQARLSPGRPARPEARGERRPTPMSEESKRKFEKTTVLRIRSAIAKLNSARVERLDQLERELDAVLEKHLPNLPSGCESKAESLRLLADGAREEARRARAEQEFRRRPGQAWVPLPAPACLARRAWALWRAAAAAREAGVLVEEDAGGLRLAAMPGRRLAEEAASGAAALTARVAEAAAAAAAEAEGLAEVAVEAVAAQRAEAEEAVRALRERHGLQVRGGTPLALVGPAGAARLGAAVLEARLCRGRATAVVLDAVRAEGVTPEEKADDLERDLGIVEAECGVQVHRACGAWWVAAGSAAAAAEAAELLRRVARFYAGPPAREPAAAAADVTGEGASTAGGAV